MKVTEYTRLTKTLNDKGILVPINDLYNHINDHNIDWYRSIYFYNDSHLKTFKEKNSIAGITDVYTRFLVWDFDSKDNLEQARQDTLELTTRLLNLGFKKDSFNICFSGNKGFSVEMEISRNLTPYQLKTVATNLAHGLETRDPKIYNPSRIFRLPYTKNVTTGLYKIPITLDVLASMTVDEIKKVASKLDNATEWNSEIVELPNELIPDPTNEGKEFKEPKGPMTFVKSIDELDFSLKPKQMPSCKYLILNGFFEAGDRSNALTALAAHFRAQGFPKEVAYHALKGAAELQSRRTGQEQFSNDEIWLNIISQVYGPHWKGGTFTCKEHEFLKKICDQCGTHACANKNSKSLVEIKDVFNSFKSYAKDIDKNTIKTGIDVIDKNIRLQTGSHVVLAGSSGSGKCLGKGTPILMYDGSIKAVEDIKVGDLIMGDDSTPRTILSLARGRETLYKVHQEDGDTYTVNESHILSLKCTSNQTFKNSNVYIGGRIVDISVKDYINASGNFKQCYKGYKTSIEFKEKDLLIDPYILGYWLGNGSKNQARIHLHKKDIEVYQYFKSFTEKKGYNFSIRQESENGIRIDFYGNKNEFYHNLVELEVANNKHIPRIYITASKKQRFELFAGLLDSDGYYDSRKNNFEFSASEEPLMKQFQWLARSLGYKCTYKKELKHYKSFTKGKLYEGHSIAYRAYLSGDNLNDIPTKLARKKAIYQVKQRYQDTTKIQLENIGIGDYYGFEIDGNKRFVLGSDFTVTHNTTMLLNILNKLSEAGSVGVFMSMDMNANLICQKLAQRVTKLDDEVIYNIYKNNDVEAIKEIEAAIDAQYKNIKFDFRSGMSIEDIREGIESVKAVHGNNVRLVVIDFINRISGPYSDETANLAFIAPKLSDLANDMGILIISLAQIARSKGGPSTPLTDSRIAKGSSAIEESATVVFGIWRPGYNKGVNDKYMCMSALKTRMGKEFNETLYFNGMTSEIRGLTSDEQIQYEYFLDELEEEKKQKNGNNGDSWS